MNHSNNGAMIASEYTRFSERDRTSPTHSCTDDASWPVMICLLGNFRLLAAGELLSTRAGGKTEALLTLLALQAGRRVPRERLVQAIWPERDPNLGRNSLSNLVSRVQKLLGPAFAGALAIPREDGYYRLNVEAGIGVDIRCFDQLVADGDQQLEAGDEAAALATYRRATELYRGDLGLGLDAPAVMERERLRTRYLTLLVQLAELLYRRSDYSVALEYLWKLLSRDPYREDAHRLVMRCHVRRGERATALHHYQVVVELLRAEFDTAPESTTTELFEQIRLQPNHI